MKSGEYIRGLIDRDVKVRVLAGRRDSRWRFNQDCAIALLVCPRAGMEASWVGWLVFVRLSAFEESGEY